MSPADQSEPDSAIGRVAPRAKGLRGLGRLGAKAGVRPHCVENLSAGIAAGTRMWSRRCRSRPFAKTTKPEAGLWLAASLCLLGIASAASRGKFGDGHGCNAWGFRFAWDGAGASGSCRGSGV